MKEIFPSDRTVLETSENLVFMLPLNWRQGKDSPNTFYSDHLECLYVYDGYIRYWEDFRSGRYKEIKFPITSEIIKNLID